MADRGKWIRTEIRQPKRYGKYNVIVIRRKANTPDVYLWNGSYWVTPRGNPSSSVIQWYDVDGDEDDE